MKRTFNAILLVLLTASIGHAADVNVLIIGAEKDSVESRRVRGKSQAFSPAGVRAELEKILGGAGLGTVNVVLEDRCSPGSDADLEAQLDAILRLRKPKGAAKPPELKPEVRKRYIESMRRRGSPCYNLASWFYWPYPGDVETKKRWPNLRGENGTKWDYVVLIGDPYTIEYMPGFYADGVARIAAEVAKGKGKTVLLMSWPGPKSESSVDHYKEVVYRTGRTGDLMVAPAGLAWQVAGKPTDDTHPGKDGAYIAAASIFSRIWNKNAKESSYTYKAALADTVYQTVTSNVGKKQYTGRFDFQSPTRFFGRKDRHVSPCKSPGGSSTEEGLCGATRKAIERAGAFPGGGPRFRIGRDSYSPTTRKDYRLGDKEKKNSTFAYRYQTNTGNPDIHLAQIFSMDIDLADQVMHESPTYRVIPRRLIWAGMRQVDPDIRPMSSHGHLSGEATHGCASYIYTIISGRCPVDPKPDPITTFWIAQMAGYKTAWRVATCQTRAPGFKAMPSSNNRHTVDAQRPETMTVQFLLQPTKTVTVSVSSDNATVSPDVMTFTPANYNVAQKVTVKVADGAAPGTEFNIQYATRSEDEVYDGLSDSWKYHVNAPPVANEQKATAFSGRTAAIALTGSDPDKEALSYHVVEKPANGSLTVSPSGVAAYTPKAGYTGADRFTFTAHDGSVHSKPATVTITVKEPTLYGFNLLLNPSGELEPFTKYKWVEQEGKWKQGAPAADGVYVFAVAEGKTAELYQDVDVSAYSKAIDAGKQSFKLSGYVDKSNDDVRTIVEFRDAAQKVLSTYDTVEKNSVSKKRRFEATELAPAHTASIRFRLRSVNKGGRGNGGKFDDLKLVALEVK